MSSLVLQSNPSSLDFILQQHILQTIENTIRSYIVALLFAGCIASVVCLDGCVEPFATALQKLKVHANAEGKAEIDKMIAETVKDASCVAKGDRKCILQNLAPSVGKEDMIKLKQDVESKFCPLLTKMTAENQKAIDIIKAAKDGEESRKAVCDVRILKAHMIDQALGQ